jgi:hypothetical protein
MAAGSVIVMAQASNTATDVPALAGISAEIRNLRIAFEEASRRQSETQALGIYLSAQQSRMVQLSEQLETARKSVADATQRRRQVSSELASAESYSARTLTVEERASMERHAENMKRDLANVIAQEQAAYNHEVEVSNMLQTENARWTDLVSRLEASVKK